jgi:hypothetical protein
VRVYTVAGLATEETRQALADYLASLRTLDTIQMVIYTWWDNSVNLGVFRAPSHLTFDVPAAPPGATHLTIEERRL